MKLNRILVTMAAAAATCVAASQAMAQGGGIGGYGGGGGGGGGFGGGGGGGGGFGRQRGGGNFDPQQMMQDAMAALRDMMSVTNDDEWRVIQDRVQKVVDASQALPNQQFNLFRLARGGGGGGRQRNNGGGPGGQGGPGGNRRGGGMFGGTPMPEAEALNTAIENNAPEGQIADAMQKYRAARQAKEQTLAKAQADLKDVLTPKQEAIAVNLGLVK